MNADTFHLALLLLGAVAFGGLLPYTRRWSETGLHALVALSAGIFLGTVFLHLVPELARAAGHDLFGAANVDDGHGHGRASGRTGAVWIWTAFAVGVGGLWWLERRLVHAPAQHRHAPPDSHDAPHHHETQHQLAWRATLFGLSIHALLTGLGLAAVAERPGHWALWSAMLLHKLTEGFSLGTLLRLASLRAARAIAIVAGFALIAPAGLVLGRFLAIELGPFADLLTAFASGTFLFVALFELLPEVWHGRERRLTRVGLVGLGVVIAGVVPRVDADGLGAAVFAARNGFLDLAPFVVVGLLLAAAGRAARSTRDGFAELGAGPDTVLATWALLGPLVAAARLLAALALAAVTRRARVAGAAGAVGAAAASFGRALAETLDDAAGRLLLGVALGGLVAALAPESWVASAALAGAAAYPLLLALAAVLRIGALGATPIGAALVERGVPVGAALVLLVGAGALDPRFSRAVRRARGARAARAQAFAGAAVALAAGSAFTLVEPHLPSGGVWTSPGASHVPEAWRTPAAVALLLLLVAAFARGLWRASRTAPSTAASAP